MMLNKFYDALDILIPNPKCELNFSQDYELLLAVMLSAQTTDKRVNEVTNVLFSKYPTVEDLASANIADVRDIIRPIGTYRKKASNIISICNHLLKDYNGIVPNNRTYLESLPGVGRKTTNVVLGTLYNEPCIAVDTHVARVSIRLGFATKKDDVLKIEKKLTRKFDKNRLNRLHHQLVLFGRYYCTARNPKCDICPFIDMCKEKQKHNK